MSHACQQCASSQAVKLFSLKGFTGSHDVGTHLGSTALTIRLPGRANHILVDEGTGEEEEEEEEDEAEMARLEQFISNVSQT